MLFLNLPEDTGEDYLLDCLERNEKSGVAYHRDGIKGDYDAFDDAEILIEYIKTGCKTENFPANGKCPI